MKRKLHYLSVIRSRDSLISTTLTDLIGDQVELSSDDPIPDSGTIQFSSPGQSCAVPYRLLEQNQGEPGYLGRACLLMNRSEEDQVQAFLRFVS